MTSAIANMLSSIRNASLVGKESIRIGSSKLIEAITEVLYKEGYIAYYRLESVQSPKKKAVFKSIVIGIKYDKYGVPVIRYTRCISKPSVRVYRPKNDFQKLLKERYSTLVLSTHKGVMCHLDAINIGIGGEVLFEVAC